MEKEKKLNTDDQFLVEQASRLFGRYKLNG